MMLGQRAAEHGLEVTDDPVDVHVVDPHRLAAPVREKLLRDRRRPLGGLADGVEILAHRRRQIGAAENEVRRAQHDEHLVVGLVGDAARQLAGDPEPLGLLVPLGGELLLGDIPLDRRGPDDVPAWIPQR